MRTLEEIIETMTLTCDVNSQYREQNADVLHYLKSYQDALKQMEENQQIIEDAVRQRDAHIKALAELKQNNPLTWFDLRTMDEKPVWLEVKNGERKWVIIWIHPDNVDEIYITDAYGLRGKLNQLLYFRGEIKAYRKER